MAYFDNGIIKVIYEKISVKNTEKTDNTDNTESLRLHNVAQMQTGQNI